MHGMSRTFSYLYDANGNRTRMTWNDGFWVGYETDGLNRVTAIREYGSTLLVSYGYDAQGRRSGVTRGNGTAISYGYDAAGRPSQIADDLAGTSHDQVLGFSYNPAGQIVQNTRSNDAYAWTGHYNVNRSYTANGLNQYTLSGSVAPSYDARGNLTQAGGPVYGYTSENMLVSASGGITLAYDPAGRLAQTSGGSAGTTRLGYDGTDLAAEYDGAGNLLRRYVHGPGTDDPLVWYEGAGTSDRRWLHPDERGSIVGVSNSSGAVTTISRYDEYGIPASTNAGRFQYTGQTWLPELGMYYYKARIYSPTLGRFLQRDPIGYEDGMNMYNYVGSDPITHSDPTGTYGCMKKEECQEIEAARRQIVNARNALAHQAGSRVSTAANDLTKIINTLGTKNDGNGLQVNFGSLKGGALGVFDPNSTTITIDKSNIANIPGGSVASTLTHEVSHARDHKLGIPYMRFLSEIKANAFAAMYEKGSGRPGVYWQPGISKEQLIRNIKESGMAYCSGAGIRSVRDYCTRVINQIHPDVPIR
jgi:RHS repeat-associated protein